MDDERDYIQDIAEIRSMMERSTKFLSLSGWAGIMAGIYALAGAWIAYSSFSFNPDEVGYSLTPPASLLQLALLALLVLALAVGTAIFLSGRKARIQDNRIWNATSRRMIVNMGVPLATGGILILVLIGKDLIGLIAPSMLLFYGLALYNAGKFTYDEIKTLGIIQVGLGLISSWFIAYSLILWALGFGVLHIVYGIYMHYRYER